MTDNAEWHLVQRYSSLLPMVAALHLASDEEEPPVEDDEWFDLDAYLIDDKERT